MATLLQRQPSTLATMEAPMTGSNAKLHPFFASPHPLHLAQEQETEPHATDGNIEGPPAADTKILDDFTQGYETANSSGQKRQKRKSTTDPLGIQSGKKRRGRQEKHAVNNDAPIPDNGFAASHEKPKPDDDPNALQPASLSNLDDNGAVSKGAEECGPEPTETTKTTKQKKMLSFNIKSGTLGSPPKLKEPQLKPSPGSKPHRSRAPRSKATMIVSVKYGLDEEVRLRIGSKIEQIIGTSTSATIPQPTGGAPLLESLDESSSETKKPQQPKIAKSTHPFFLAKAPKVKSSTTAETPLVEARIPASPSQKRFMSTPCSPQRSRASPAEGMRNQGMGHVHFGARHLGLKIPGARLPAWPWKGVARVGCDDLESLEAKTPSLAIGSRKAKGQAALVTAKESIMNEMTRQLNVTETIDELKSLDSDKFTPAPPELRLPRKHCESGLKLQQRVRSQLKTVEFNTGISRFFDSIKSSLAAHDRSECESTSWTQKYAPASVCDVLQAERETLLLKEWLVALQVQSVDTGASEAGTTSKKGGAKGVDSGKKRRKRNKLDDFVVSSEEEDELDELSETECEAPLTTRAGLVKKTVIRTADAASSKSGRDAPRLKNAVVISGPHGCGKTAAVYAVAKELGYEVFEISPGSRRSGKDILEKIGDMTRNHLVQHRQTSTAILGDGDDRGSLGNETADEVQTGQQATLGSFFKPKAASKPEAKVKAATSAPAQAKQSQAKKAITKSQKQSLILLEEVDILYEEDKAFWSTVMGLMAQSKRPFIMTCNDESLVPLQALSLHGIFRFSAPPIDAAVDRLLIIAAHEGHALRRSAVESLYESRGCDLRASIAELNYWCQIGVGDRRGGFDWFYLRWPKGIDRDANGDVVRVVSEDTYQEGMGWLPRNLDSAAGPGGQQREEQLLEQTWSHFEFDLGAWQYSPPMTQPWVPGANITSVESRAGRVAALEAYDDFAGAMSVADLCAAMEPSTSNELQIDATLPTIPLKARDDFILGRSLIEADPVTSFDSVGSSISVSLKTLAKKGLNTHYLSTQDHHLPPPALAPLGEGEAVSAIRTRLAQPSAAAPAIDRLDFSLAFDPIAVSDDAAAAVSSHLDPSVWDRTMKIITLDVAPYVRAIVAFDTLLQQQRARLSSLLLSQGGVGPRKRMRTTRAAYSALEGGQRSTTRAERWFKADINPHLVRATAPKGCADLPMAQPPPPPPVEPGPAAGDVAGLVSSSDEGDDASPPLVVPRARKRAKGARRIKNVLVESSYTSEDELAR